MAGESPDRSERESSSGETPEDTGSVPPAPPQDPRAAWRLGESAPAAPSAQDPDGESVPVAGDGGRAPGPEDAGAEHAAETSGEASEMPGATSGEPANGDAGDARLRAAVAAWVSGDGSGDQQPGQGDEAPRGTEEGAEGTTPESAGAMAGDLPVRTRPADGSHEGSIPGSASEESSAGSGEPIRAQPAEGEGEADRDIEEVAAQRAERMTAAFFGASRTSTAEEDKDKGDEGSEADEGDEGYRRDAEGGESPSEDERVRADGTGLSERSPSGAGADVSGTDASGSGGGEGAVGSSGGESPMGGDTGATSGRTSGAEDGASQASDQVSSQDDKPDGRQGADDPTDGDGASAGDLRGATEMAGQRDQPTTTLRARDVAAAKQGVARQATEAPADGGVNPAGSPGQPAGTAATAAAPPPESPPSPPVPPQAPAQPSQARQQVADPPPMELLAQLTNTPAPPATPARTAVRRLKIWTPLVVVLGIVFTIVQTMRPLPEPTLALSVPSSYTFEGQKPSLPWPSEGQAVVHVAGLGSLGSYGKQEPVPIASIAKAMTAYVVLQDHPLQKGEEGPMITVDKKAEEVGKNGGNQSVLDTVEAGDKLSLSEALHAIMIPSANNIARLLARWNSGSEEAFVKEMNATAKKLGMENTTYTDPSGLKSSTVSTAADQVILGKELVKIDALMAITKKPKWTDPSGKVWTNWNHLIPYNGSIGIKTGTTTAAGGNLLFAGRKEVGGTTQVIVGAVLGQRDSQSILDAVVAASRKLLVEAGDSLTARTVVEKGEVVGYVDDQLGGRTPLVAAKDLTAVGWGGQTVPLALKPTRDGTVPHTAEAGEKVGYLTAGEGASRTRVPVKVQEDLTEPGFGDKLTRIL